MKRNLTIFGKPINHLRFTFNTCAFEHPLPDLIALERYRPSKKICSYVPRENNVFCNNIFSNRCIDIL